MPILFVFDFLTQIFTFDRFANDSIRLTFLITSIFNSFGNFDYRMTIDGLGWPTKSLESTNQNLRIMLIHRLLRLSQSIHINEQS